MKITRLTVQNLLRIKLAEVTPTGALVIVAGRNDAGKSSLLNSIAIALSGKDLPAMPIRAGSTQGHVILETEDLVVTRKFSASGGGSLEVRDAAGAKVMAPQEKLNTLLQRVTYDPVEFIRMEPAKQVETLRRILHLDFTALDAEYRDKYDQRTVLNRQVKEQDGKLKGITRDPAAPSEEVKVSDLAQQMSEARKANDANDRAREDASALCDDADDAAANVKRANAAVETARRVLDEAIASETAAGQALATAIAIRDRTNAIVAERKDIDIEAIVRQMQEVEAINRAVAANRQWTEEHRRMVSLQQQSNGITERLSAIEQAKADALAAAQFPVPGLGFSDQGVTFNSIPFDQVGSAVKIRTSLAIAASLNPKLPVMLIRDGSLLDDDSMEIVSKYAEEKGLQIWLECVSDREDATVIIEDGEVSRRPLEEKAKKAKSK